MKSFSFLITLLLSATAFAEGAEYEVVQAPKTVIADSSEHHRIDKKYQINAILTGIGPSLTGTAGLQFGKFLDNNSLLLVELTRGSLTTDTNTSSSALGSKYDISSRSVGVHYKRYEGNSFYWSVGGDYRTLDYDYKNNFLTPEYSRSFKGSSLAANFKIGNQWQWDNFTLGCDWVGYSLPLTSNISDESLTGSSSSNAGYMRDDEDTFVKKGNINLLRFYLGASF